MEFLGKWILVFFIFVFLAPNDNPSDKVDGQLKTFFFLALSCIAVGVWGMN